MQIKNADIIFQDHQFLVTGDLHFSNVMSLYEKSLPQLRLCSELSFDFSQLTSSDSAGLALIIEWIKFSKKNRKTIQFIHLSNAIVSIAKAAGINNLINGASTY